MAENQLMTIVGVGDQLGLALSRYFGKKGFTIAMIARNTEALHKMQKKLEKENIESYYFTADVTDEVSYRKVFGYIKDSLGNTDVLIYNASSSRKSYLLQENTAQMTYDFQVNVVGALIAVQEILPGMEQKKEGKIFFTGRGVSLEPDWRYGSLGIGKSGLRNAAYALHQELKAKNIHVATVTICGMIQPEAEKYNPPAIAQQFWKLYQQKQENFEKEIVY